MSPGIVEEVRPQSGIPFFVSLRGSRAKWWLTKTRAHGNSRTLSRADIGVYKIEGRDRNMLAVSRVCNM